MRQTDSHLYFYGRSIFSNFQRCLFTDPIINRSFPSSEIHFMYSKAMFFNDTRIAVTLLNTQESAQAKILGRQIQGYNDTAWDIMRYAYMNYAIYLKFSQNPHFKKALLDTNNLILVEASPTDGIWGVKLDEDDDRILDEANWQGQNLLGKALMELRDRFRKEIPKIT